MAEILKDFLGWIIGGFGATSMLLFANLNSKIDTKADKDLLDLYAKRQDHYDTEISNLYSKLNDAIAERR